MSQGELRSRLTVQDDASKKYVSISKTVEKFGKAVSGVNAELISSTDKLTKKYFDNLDIKKKVAIQDKFLKAGSSRLKQEIVALDLKYASLLDQMKNQEGASKKVQAATLREASAVATAINEAKKFQKEELRLARAQKKATEAAKKQTKGLKGLAEGFSSAFPGLSRIATSPIMAVTAGLATFGLGAKKASAVAMDFEAAMARVGAVSNSSEAELKSLSDSVQQNARITEHTATATAEAAQALAMAGLKSAQISAALPATLQLATVGAMEVGQAAEVSMRMMAVYGLELDDLQRSNDVLAKASTRAMITVEGLGDGFAKAGPIAKNSGMALEETAAIISKLADAGFEGSEGGTAVRNAIARLADPTPKAAAQLKRLGVELKDSEGRFVGLTNVIEQLQPHVKDTQAIFQIFGKFTAGQMQALMGEGAEGIRELTEELKNSGGTAQEVADKQLNTLSGRVKVLGSETEGLAISIGNALMPMLKAVVGAATRAVKPITWVIGKVGSVGALTLQILSTIPQAIEYIGTFITLAIQALINEAMKGANFLIRGINKIFGKTISPFDVLDDEGMTKLNNEIIADVGNKYAGFRDQQLDVMQGFHKMTGEINLTKVANDELNKSLKKMPVKTTDDGGAGDGGASGAEREAEKTEKRIQKMMEKSLKGRFSQNAEYYNNLADLQEDYAKAIQDKEDERTSELESNLRENIQLAVNLGQTFVDSFVAAKNANETFGDSLIAGLKAMTIALFNEISSRLIVYGVEAAAKAMSKESEKGMLGLATGAIAGGMFLSMITGLAANLNKGGIIKDGKVGVDSVPALLSKGEMVLPKNITDQILNLAGKPSSASGSVQVFNKGGIVQGETGLNKSIFGGTPHTHPSANPVNLQVNTLALPDRSQARRWLRDTVAPELSSLKRSGLIHI